MLNKLSITDLDMKGKRVFMRVDFNVPLNENLEITDDLRIKESLKSIKYALDQGARLILASHMGRPEGEYIFKLSMMPVAVKLGELLGQNVYTAPDCVGPRVETMAKNLKDGEVLLLENLRFHTSEKKNGIRFAKELASLADIYVNDAFGTCHREHASIEGITHFIDQSASGFLLEKEIKYFDQVLKSPERPFMAILGGAKLKTKIPIIENLIENVDTFLVGGGMTFTFLAAKGYSIGNSLLDERRLDLAKELLDTAEEVGKEILLPVDVVVADKFANTAEFKTVPIDQIPDGWMGLDIGPETAKLWAKRISEAKTICWNGPMGAFEMNNFSNGTIEIGKAVANAEAVSIVGGGDSAFALELAGVKDKITHVSTGGGSSLDFMAGKKLPGIYALTDK